MIEELLDDREQAVQDRCAELLLELAQLRAFDVPDDETPGPEVHGALRDVRARLDRAGEVCAEIRRHRRRARRVAKSLAAAAADAFDVRMDQLARKAVRLEYQSVKDREAMARVATSPERRKARAAERLADLVDEADEAARSLFSGLLGIREELLATLRYLPWEASLER